MLLGCTASQGPWQGAPPLLPMWVQEEAAEGGTGPATNTTVLKL